MTTPTDYYSLGCENEEDPASVVGASVSAEAKRVRADIEKTSSVMVEINGKVSSSSVRQQFKDHWATLYGRWLDFTRGNPLLKGDGASLSNLDLSGMLYESQDFRKKSLLMYQVWKKEISSEKNSAAKELIDKNIDKWKATKWGLGLLAIIATIWGGKRLINAWTDDRREKKRQDREDRRMERLESLGLIEPMGGMGSSMPAQATASPTVTPVTIVMPQGAIMSGAPQIAVHPNPYEHHYRNDGHESPQDVAARVMRALPSTPPPLFPRSRQPEPPVESGDFEELPDAFGQPEPQGY